MATYKMIQDIEAEDKILGPLTLRQFIYGLITAFLLYLCFIVVTKHAGFLLVLFLPPAIFTGFFTFPFGKDQPTEVWAVAKIRFLFKPRKRIWDQSGVKELVTVTVPKKIERIYTDGLSQTEVRSRLQALANTIDSRGWAVKNVNVNLYAQPSALGAIDSSDRLVNMASMPQPVPDFQVQASDDILDEQSNPIAQQFDQMISASSQAHRQQLMDELNGVRTQEAAKTSQPPADYWFMNQPAEPARLPADQAMFSKSQVVQPGADANTATSDGAPTADEVALLGRIKAQNDAQPEYDSHLKTIQPLSQAGPAKPVDSPSVPSAATTDPTILNLANNNDLNVATLAREAYKAKNPDEPQDEVVISLR